MLVRKFVCLVGALLLLVACKEQNTCSVEKIPVSDFFRNPDRASYKLSPDGKYLAYLAPFQDRLNIFVQYADGDSAWRITSQTDRDLSRFGWAGNEQLYFLKDNNGDENYFLSTVDVKGEQTRALTQFEGVRTEIIDELTQHPNKVLVALNKRNPQIFDVYELDLSQGELQLQIENPGNYSQYLTDETGRVRLIVTTDGTNQSFLHRGPLEAPFEKLFTIGFKDAFVPIKFHPEQPHWVYALSNIGRDKKAAVLFDLKKQRVIQTLFEHPSYDVDWLIFSQKTHEPLFAQYTDWKMQYHFLADRAKQLYAKVAKELDDFEVVFTGTDEAETKVVIRTYSDRTMGSYYLYDLATGQLRLLADASPWLKMENMAAVKPIAYTSRDGLKIHGYLTIPKGGKNKNLPLVVVPHGGPWIRDVWRFDQNVQFLANRGYAVLQMNFRGSTGYGRAFWEASFKQWGKNMQNDITDGVKHVINQGIADPNRIAIYGGSYGGYAVLAGLAFTPDLYACGIDYVGVSNLFTLMQTIPPYWEPGRAMFYEMIGHPQADSLHYVQASPVFHADKIKVPLMVVQGAKDPRVKKAEADQIVEALAARGVEVDYILRDDEGHGFRKQENRIALYESIETFLERHLKQ
ncbi:MAG: S9 family peptidase [Sphingobacteriaceae bacterium]|nr:S9 family peptidase [Sphingobacteriaceae bacterium]